VRHLMSLLSLVFLAVLLACGGGGSSAPPPTGRLTLRLGSDSFPGYVEAFVSIEKVEASMDGTHWTTLGTVQASYDLLALQSGHSAQLVSSVEVTAGTYTQFRLTWATVNYFRGQYQPAFVSFPKDIGIPLNMPPSMTTVVTGSINVPANGIATAQLMFSGQQAVQQRTATGYAFQATGTVHDLNLSARITGHLADPAGPLKGVEVFAETADGLGVTSIQRRAFTDASGNYVLEGLPTGSVYFVAAQPSVTASVYAAAAATSVDARSATSYTADMAFSTPMAPGSMTITITPASLPNQGTWVELRQMLVTGPSEAQMLIVRSQPVVISATQDQAGLTGLAPGSYGVTAQRSSSGGPATMKKGNTIMVDAIAPATTTLTFP